MPKSTSLWIDTAQPFNAPPLTSDTAADVCVVGAGIAGLTTAYLLAREGRSVIVIDANTVGGGETAVTTAHLSSVIDNTFKEMLQHIRGQQSALSLLLQGLQMCASSK